MSVQTLKRLFTTTEYHRMAEAGIFNEDDRLELVRGEIIEMSPIGSRHAACVNRLNHLLALHIAGRALISVQNPLHLDEYSEPQPDIMLLRPRSDFYAQAHPQPEDVLLLIEVAETSLTSDREVKIPLYAQAGIIEVWLVALDHQMISICRQPSSRGYTRVSQAQLDQVVSPIAFPDLELVANKILG